MKPRHNLLSKKTAFYALILFFGLVLSLATLEFFLSKFLPQKTFDSLYKNANHCWASSDTLPFTLKPNCQHRTISEDFDFVATTNSRGFRGEEIVMPKRTNEKRIIITGDSFIFGNGVGESDTIPAKLEQKLTQSCHPERSEGSQIGDSIASLQNDICSGPVEVINAGFMGGLAPDGHLLNLKRMLGEGYNPDLVIMSVFVFNDISDMETNIWSGIGPFSTPTKVTSKNFEVSEDGLLINRDIKSIYKNPILKNSHLAIFLSENFPILRDKVKNKLFGTKPFIPASVEPTDEGMFGIQSNDCIFGEKCHRKLTHVFSDLEAVLKAGRQIVEGKPEAPTGAKFMVMLIPVDFQVYSDVLGKYGGELQPGSVKEAYTNPNPQPQKRIKEALSREGIAYLDLLPSLRENSQPRMYFAHDAHFNELGTDFAAEQISQWIQGHWGI